MFSGIVETTSLVTQFHCKPDSGVLKVKKPSFFNDLKAGDSVSVDGVCLTIESVEGAPSREDMVFSIGKETLNVTNWAERLVPERHVNLERSLRYGDRIHGHLVSGHVECLGELSFISELSGSTLLQISIPQDYRRFVAQKGSIAINGVSLTVNSLNDGLFSVCLIPETLRRTNLRDLKVGHVVNIETDFLLRSYLLSKDVQHELY